MKEEKHIFEEVRVGRLRLRNRLVRSATWLGLAAPDGSLPEEAFATYRELAEGGVGAIEASGNGTSVAGVRPGRGEAYFLPFAARLAREVPVPGVPTWERAVAAIARLSDGALRPEPPEATPAALAALLARRPALHAEEIRAAFGVESPAALRELVRPLVLDGTALVREASRGCFLEGGRPSA